MHINETLILLAAASSSVDPWGMPVQQQTQPPQQQLDPWGASAGASAAPAVTSDPWSPVKEPPRVSPLPNLGPAPTSKIFKNISRCYFVRILRNNLISVVNRGVRCHESFTATTVQ